MSKINVATYLIENLSENLSNDVSAATRGNIIAGIIEAWDKKNYLTPIPTFEMHHKNTSQRSYGRQVLN